MYDEKLNYILVVVSVGLINTFCSYGQATWEAKLWENWLEGEESAQKHDEAPGSVVLGIRLHDGDTPVRGLGAQLAWATPLQLPCSP